MEGGGWMMEGGGWMMEGGGWMMEGGPLASLAGWWGDRDSWIVSRTS